MTINYERIKNMTVEEMAERIIATLPIDSCLLCVGCPDNEFESEFDIDCKKYIKQWLQAESEDNNGR